MSLPRPEYPRPQFVRSEWLCLNGEWEFEIDAGDSGSERGLKDRELTGKIIVPFCPESALSGVEHKDFMNAVWYRPRRNDSRRMVGQKGAAALSGVGLRYDRLGKRRRGRAASRRVYAVFLRLAWRRGAGGNGDYCGSRHR